VNADGRILLIDLGLPGREEDGIKQILEQETSLGRRNQLLTIRNWSDRDFRLCERILTLDPSLILVGLPLTAAENAKQRFESLKPALSKIPTIAIVDVDKPDDLTMPLQLGRFDFMTLPIRPAELTARIHRALGRMGACKRISRAMHEEFGLQQLVGESAIFLEEVKKVTLLASSNVGVLISGETGTGKELFARAIQYLSARSGGPFVPINCGAIPLELIENELFGHERGAFTGASGRHTGLIQEADGGTVFLDEVDSLPLQGQVKLLRFLQNKEYRQLGAAKILRADVRVITASNIDLEEAARSGGFRRDLYYRLSIVPITLPPLRMRREDIPRLAKRFLLKYAVEFASPASEFSTASVEKLLLYSWPGNVRELENTVQRAIILCRESTILPCHIVLPNNVGDRPNESFER
jgi:DNA-binding NtrC family response regulator